VALGELQAELQELKAELQEQTAEVAKLQALQQRNATSKPNWQVGRVCQGFVCQHTKACGTQHHMLHVSVALS
jgi:hypothetical protein